MAMSEARELVSVIVPAYDAEKHIGSALASILGQSYPHLEILVVDDGSRDRTGEIVAAIAAEDARVQLLRQVNEGVAAARNTALARAKGTLIAPMDADDVWHPEKIARQLAILRRNGPGVGLVYTWSSTIDDAGRVIERCACTGRLEGMVFPELVLDNFIGPASTPLIRRTAIEDAGGYDATLAARGAPGCEDYKLNLAIAERCAFAVAPEFLVGYRQTASSMSQHALLMKRSYDLVMAEVRRRHPELPARLFRWSEGNFCLYLGAKCVLGGRSRQALKLLPRALRGDWAFVFRPKVRRVLSRKLRNRCEGEQAFFARSPEATSTDLLSVGRREERRQREVAGFGANATR